MKKSAKKTKKPVKAKKKSSPAKKRAKQLGAQYYAQSKRLGFRLIEASDEALYCELFTDAKTVQHVCAPLTEERAKQSFAKALAKSHQKPWVQRISVVVERSNKKPLGIASIKMLAPENRVAEVGILLKPSAHAHRYGTEASQALITSAFRRHSIDGISAQVPAGHKAGERLVATLGYDKGESVAAVADRPARSAWSMHREKWASTYK
jgi:RimJ/RimL family protein N-acetyltransferase